MRTNPHVKIFFGVLIALAALTTVIAPARVMSAGQAAKPSFFAATPDTSGQELRLSLPVASKTELFPVSPLKAKRPGTPAGVQGSSVSFLPPVTYDSGGWGPVSVVIADVNGDGKPEVVTANYCKDECSGVAEGTVGVLLGRGDGTFQPAVSYNSGGNSAASVAVADLNGDGKPDVIVANYSSGTVGVLLGNGDGSFQQVAIYGSGGPLIVRWLWRM